jgi:hypothetical protein
MKCLPALHFNFVARYFSGRVKFSLNYNAGINKFVLKQYEYKILFTGIMDNSSPLLANKSKEQK